MNYIFDTVQSQHHFFYTNKTKSLSFRIASLKALSKGIQKYEHQIIEALYKDFKKPPFESFTTEVYTVLSEINYFIKNLHKLTRIKKVPTPVTQFLSTSTIYPEPYGVCLIISPWNYPFQLAIAPLIGAIAAGNCAIIKPSEYTPNTTEILKKVIEEIFPPYYICVIDGNEDVAQELLDQPLDYIFFTGGTNVGKKVMEKAAQNLVPITLELGGKSPCIVDLDAHIPTAARRIVWGKFINAGQTCVAPDYILVHEKIKDQLLYHICKYITKFYSREPESSPNYARVINERHFDRLVNYIDSNKVYFGGKSNRDNLFITPTILHNVTMNDLVMEDEIFGPILPVLTFRNLSEAVSIVHAKPKPLALYYFGENKKRIRYVQSRISFGGGCINDTIMHVASPNLPFGGIGYSGLGSYHGKASFDTFTHYKSILSTPTSLDLPLRYPPYKWKLSLVRKLIKHQIR